ncbi:hypothetical protein DTO164E3_2444 [Paecilomyces variotii]|nr:hypothetical protein DTO164E3_2444 [Paecilomyces variotii]KAJ9206863.1 hypothetical protein DTO032I3_1451 [Paecilomyces variotii]KAJ9281376.1 hypothetical protein DTO021D3_1599 [Paecilomyces variotii]KAJ9346635.1 hypothetical protein DTO027B6_889 [Paecilomyces variotii]KAJ9391160.1 hypothetical protein DTO032I4_1516 [Paecilomyces variotii]
MARSRKRRAESMSTDSGSETTADLHNVLSDESSFYGDSDEKERLEDLVSDFDVAHYWETVHPRSLATVQYRAQKAAVRAAVDAEEKTKAKATSEQRNAESLAGKFEPDTSEHSQTVSTNPRTTRQPTESVEEFLSRLPPSTTKAAAPVGPWIYIYNPRDNPHIGSVSTLVARGTELLRNYEDRKAALEVEHHKTTTSKTKSSAVKPRSNAALGRKLVPLRRSLEASLFALARETGVISGKWMLFPTADHVDEVWAAVAQATANDELGVAAKVATDNGSEGGRLVAIYTRDYDDKKDVKRVLERLVELGLVDRGSTRPIYYKCDAYTYLDIKSTNQYGLKASLYSSREALGWKGLN